MDNTMYVALSRQMTLRRELDIVANNIANANTNGFKMESAMVRTDASDKAKMVDGPKSLKFVIDDGVLRDFGQGVISQTGGAFDLAIDGQGYFQVRTAAGDRYTRDGRFTLSPDGRLTTQKGDPVLGEGAEIIINPEDGPVTIAQDGTLSQKGQRIGKIDVMTFDDLAGLSKEGSNLLRNTSNVPPQVSTVSRIKQGMLEGSNVDSITQVTRLIEISRAYESMARTIEGSSELSRRSVERLGRVA
ncbi:flagellar basal-body rod protein FlgF [Caulobacter mirabilis]|uniref:Flagellar basal-body rod protein FlgF n=1 Tax=Caulobacter mirabilis TaxID=69666 RepID=A0A2D2B0C5_9CAUL|nr:flagellar basal-body rod protein FlgF [Caulobacter mirabilis]ATQ43710.1 flagellar basal-body rod protein FlgF [Caulobacter mirabilis]